MLALHASLEKFMLPCMNKKLFGIECPGCGLQRSIALLLRGEFIDAFFMYPAIYTLIPLLGLFIFSKLSPKKNVTLLINIFSFATVGLIIINYIIKLLH
ncbi:MULTISPECIES: DUF2752 domain-containing protein [Flavobacteriaceae]|uniref:DUF2752 domain-containing protein n=1 Tax=Flavobacteriaceae TaxID=49546 RepID=UPI0010AE414A|nr:MULTISPECIES: DUF2752 domain-containing protein [Flavobacteriaceae]NJB37601.1 DUF2752 domain-containing protein [Croceivirga sp. JEA036]TKD62430.1 DUF2752 domain-containing protein [Flavobacterium sp. ASW18X]